MERVTELVPVPPADVERAKAFYVRFVPMTPTVVDRAVAPTEGDPR